MKHAFSKTMLGTALVAMSIGGVQAHSILNGYLSAPGPSTGYDVFRTTCFTDNPSSPVGLTDAAGNQWTLPFINGSGSTAVTSQVVFALSKVGSGSDSDTITATVAYADAGNVGCYTSGNTNASGQPNLDADCSGGTNANNILSALDGTVEVSQISSTAYSTEWEPNNNQPSISGTKLLSPLGTGSYAGWKWGHLKPAGIDQTGGAHTNANGEYVIIIENQGATAHHYDFIAHCVNAAAASHPNQTVDPTYHTGQGSGWVVNNPGTSGAYLSEGADYSQVVTDGASH